MARSPGEGSIPSTAEARSAKLQSGDVQSLEGKMRRRDFTAGLGVGAVWPLFALADPPVLVPLVGFLNSQSASDYQRQLAAFRDALAEAGYVDGQNVNIEYRWADNHTDRLPAMMAELVNKKASVIAATSTPAALAAKAGEEARQMKQAADSRAELQKSVEQGQERTARLEQDVAAARRDLEKQTARPAKASRQASQTKRRVESSAAGWFGSNSIWNLIFAPQRR